MTVRLANGPVSWGVSLPRTPQDPPWELTLDGICSAGYDGTELGPYGYFPTDPARLKEELRSRGLQLAGGFIYDSLHDEAARDRVIESVHQTGRLLHAADARFLVVMDAMNPTRQATGGREHAAKSLDPARWSSLVKLVREIGRVAQDEYGLRAAFHPHVGSYVEFSDEIEALFNEIEPSYAGFCLDTGHAAYAGLDPVELCNRYSARLSYLHFKDVNPGVLARVREEALDWDTAVREGIFCDLGEGMVDFGGLAAELDKLEFNGWGTVEQDIIPGTEEDPREAAQRNVSFLRTLGLGGTPEGKR